MNWLKSNVVGVVTMIMLAISGFTANSIAIAVLESRLSTLESVLDDKVITIVKLEDLSTNVAVIESTQVIDRKDINSNRVLIEHVSTRVYLADKSTAVTNSILEKLSTAVDKLSENTQTLSTITTLLDSKIKNLEYDIKQRRENNEN